MHTRHAAPIWRSTRARSFTLALARARALRCRTAASQPCTDRLGLTRPSRASVSQRSRTNATVRSSIIVAGFNSAPRSRELQLGRAELTFLREARRESGPAPTSLSPSLSFPLALSRPRPLSFTPHFRQSTEGAPPGIPATAGAVTCFRSVLAAVPTGGRAPAGERCEVRHAEFRTASRRKRRDPLRLGATRQFWRVRPSSRRNSLGERRTDVYLTGRNLDPRSHVRRTSFRPANVNRVFNHPVVSSPRGTARMSVTCLGWPQLTCRCAIMIRARGPSEGQAISARADYAMLLNNRKDCGGQEGRPPVTSGFTRRYGRAIW